MGKPKTNKHDIVISCDSPEVFNVLVAILSQGKDEITQQIKNTLTRTGIESDPIVTINADGSIKASKRSYDKGPVIVSDGGKKVSVKAYKELEKQTVYVLPQNNQFGVYVKTGTGIDTYLGHFPNWGSLVTDLGTVKAPAPTAEVKQENDAEVPPVMEVSE